MINIRGLDGRCEGIVFPEPSCVDAASVEFAESLRSAAGLVEADEVVLLALAVHRVNQPVAEIKSIDRAKPLLALSDPLEILEISRKATDAGLMKMISRISSGSLRAS